MKQVQLSLKDESGSLVETVSGTFAPGDLVLFRSFVELMARVRSCGLLQRGMPSIGNFKWESGSNMTFTCAPYTNDELHGLLHVLRPVILQKEAASFQNISALLGRRFSSKNLAAHFKTLRAVFEHGEMSMYMQISVGGQPLFDESFLHLWLNGAQYHTDAEKAAAWRLLETSLNTENARGLVMTQLQGKVKALFNLEYIVNLVLTKCSDA